tara:strand:+ start:18281 stop:19144 length:864 start_codon:yes stop_codon:yes gene_type:complete
MGTHNGTVFGTILKHKGDQAWSDLSTWTAYDTWIRHEDNTNNTAGVANLTATGAKGTPLRYQTSIIDLGESKYVYPAIQIGAFGTARITVEYGDASDLSDKTTIGTYTTNNDVNGVVATYSILNHTEPGYSDAGTTTISSTTYNLDYEGFKARYVRITVFVERFLTATQRDATAIRSLLIEFNDDQQTEVLYDVDTSTLSGTVEARVLVPRIVSSITSMQLTAHSEANKKLVPHIVSKANKTIRLLDANTFSTAGVDGTVDVAITGTPEVEESPNGSLDRKQTGVGN